jgi:RHS repeat-associated protein
VISQTQRASRRGAPHRQIDEEFQAIAADLVGTPSEVVSPEGNIAWQHWTTAWGASAPQGLNLVECPLRFPGQYFDQESESYYNLFRYYEPSAVRYLSSDPLGLALGPNPHGYVTNPWHWIDPLGLGPCNTDLVDLSTPARRRHILDGEVRPNGTYGGGHRAGTGFPGKSEFPANWSDDQTMHHISDVATDPVAVRWPGRGSDVWARGTRDRINIEVLVRREKIWAAYPTNLPLNP